MHELSIIASLFEILLQKAVEQKALETVFEAYKKGTIAEAAVLEIEEPLLKVFCQDCGLEALQDNYIFVCPACGSPNLKILQGTELFLEKIELEIE